jgi:hypothetical protein
LEYAMIGLLIGGTVVFCAGLVTVVFGIPIKEFSFGNTMILAGAVVSCTGLILIGLYFVGRELRGLAGRMDAGFPAAALSETRETVVPAAIVRAVRTTAEPPKPARSALARPMSGPEDTLFVRDQPHDLGDFADEPASPEARPSAPAFPWERESAARTRHPVEPLEPLEPLEPVSEPPKRQRRNIMFSSTRREPPPREQLQRDLPSAASDPGHQPADDFQDHNPSPSEPVPASRNLFDAAWPQSDRPRRDSAALRNGRVAPTSEGDEPEAAPERYQPPHRAEPEAEAVTIVKSGVVDSMAYSLYSDGSIEAQMPEGMVRFASIDELRAHLDQRS